MKNHQENRKLKSNLNSDSSGRKIFFHSRIQELSKLLLGYDGKIPFSRYLKEYFSKNKKFGSTDRKVISEWCYCFFRLGNSFKDADLITRLGIGYYLLNGPDTDLARMVISNQLGEEFTISDQADFQLRFSSLQQRFPEFNIRQLFSFDATLSDGISKDEISRSILQPPKVWVRLSKKTNREVVAEECDELNIKYSFDDEIQNAISFPGTVNLQQLPSFKKGTIQIQDRSSQLAGSMIPVLPNEHWWDCCCGAGGKSLQLLDTIPGINITATDKRSSILENFKLRLGGKNNSKITMHVADLESGDLSFLKHQKFDGILADVPCSGSGTWSRTPEMLSFFEESVLTEFVNRQKRIVQNAVNFLKPGGHFVYMTCSVFWDENEGVSDFISSFDGMKKIKSGLINGISYRADSLYYAVFQLQSIS